jgi:transposase
MSGHRLPPHTIRSVVEHIAAGDNNTEVSQATRVSRNAIRKMRLSLEYWGTPYAPRAVRLGRPRLLVEAHRLRLVEFLRGRPHAYLDEMAEFLYDEFDVEVSTSTIWRELERMRWSRKLATKRAREQSAALRRVYLARMAQHYTADQIIALDESACNERTGDRKYGWSAINEEVEVVYSFRRSERWSLLPALTIDGYMSYLIYQGSITAELIEDFIEYQVLPYCNSHPAPASVLVLDNASIHRSPRIRELCERDGVRLEYLPPYSPDYNPIEKSFKMLKSWIKRYTRLQEEFSEFDNFLKYAVQQVCCQRDFRSVFRECGYPLRGS